MMKNELIIKATFLSYVRSYPYTNSNSQRNYILADLKQFAKITKIKWH